MAAAISVFSPKSTTALQRLDLLKQPNFKFLSGSPSEGFSLNLKPGGGSKAKEFPGLVVSASAGTTTTATAGGGSGRLYVNFTGFPFPLGPFLNRRTIRTEVKLCCPQENLSFLFRDHVILHLWCIYNL